MAITVNCAAVHGIEASTVVVEIDFLRRLPNFTIVGLANHAVRESTERVRSAIVASGMEFPRVRVVVNLAPADLPKSGTAFDLAIAVGILAAQNSFEQPLEKFYFAGELSLSGELRPVPGAIAFAKLAKATGKVLVLPEDSACEAALLHGVNVVGAKTLKQVIEFLTNHTALCPAVPRAWSEPDRPPDLSEVNGQQVARRALEIAAVGAHHLLLTGPPGCGKSMLARRLPGILPPLSHEEALTCLQIRSMRGRDVKSQRWSTVPPLRTPHHSISSSGLAGDRHLRPGELSLAHHGVLFLDEIAEFSRGVIETLRQPLEEGTIHLSKAAGSVTLPAQTVLVLAANPCPCGYFGTHIACICTDTAIHRYRQKLSGPILDRLDLHVELLPVPPEELFSTSTVEDTVTVQRRVIQAKQFASERGQLLPNSRLNARELHQLAPLKPESVSLLKQSMHTLGISARASLRTWRVSRTIADLDQSPAIETHHLAESIGLRPHLTR